MVVEELVEVVGLRGGARFGGELHHFMNLARRGFFSRELEREGLQLNPNFKNLLSVCQGELRYLCAGKGGPLDESLVLEFDQGFANQTLSDSELLRQPPFYDLFAGL